MHCRNPPPPLILTRPRFWVRGQRWRNTGSPCLDKARVTGGTYHGTHVAGLSQPDPSKHHNTKQQPSVHPRTQEHMESQPHQHFDTHMDPSCSPAHSHKPHSLLEWEHKNDVSKKGPKVRKHGVAVFGHARVRPRGVTSTDKCLRGVCPLPTLLSEGALPRQAANTTVARLQAHPVPGPAWRPLLHPCPLRRLATAILRPIGPGLQRARCPHAGGGAGHPAWRRAGGTGRGPQCVSRRGRRRKGMEVGSEAHERRGRIARLWSAT